MSSDFVDEIDDILDDWEDSRDAAFWAADGSHEHDPPWWTTVEDVDIEAVLAQLAMSTVELRAWVAAIEAQIVRVGNAFVERVLDDLQHWRPTGLRQLPPDASAEETPPS
jgi:hypothetical protein